MRRYRKLTDTQLAARLIVLRKRRESKLAKIRYLRKQFDMSKLRNRPRLWKWQRRAAVHKREIARLVAEQVRRWRRRHRTTYPNATHYSEHFTRAELNCKGPECAGKQPPPHIQARLSKLAKTGLEPLRLLRLKRGEKGVGILSGYRCLVHNRRVNGATGSRHLKGDAADFIPTGTQASWVEDLKAVRAFYNGGIGAYSNGGVHGDIRGWIARWTSF